MPIPPFQSYLLPALQLMNDGQDWTYTKITESLSVHFKLTEEDRAEMLLSGIRPRYKDRAIWALTYLFQAGLVMRRSRGVYFVTSDGRALVEAAPQELTQKYLIKHYPTFAKFCKPNPTGHTVQLPPSVDIEIATTPTERLEEAFEELESVMKSELLERIADISPYKFERLVLDVLLAMGYAKDKESLVHTGKTGDAGIDGIVFQDHLGLDRVFIQAKNQESSISGPDINSFIGAMDLQNAVKGVFFTRSTFTKQADEHSKRSSKRVILIDGERLSGLMIRFGIGVTTVEHYKVCRLDGDYFEDVV